jgi:hypothetical protein
VRYYEEDSGVEQPYLGPDSDYNLWWTDGSAIWRTYRLDGTQKVFRLSDIESGELQTGPHSRVEPLHVHPDDGTFGLQGGSFPAGARSAPPR